MWKYLSNLKNARLGTSPLHRGHPSPVHVSSQMMSMFAQRKDNAESQQRYEPGSYHPVRPGEIYNERYRVMHKLGWGQYSTVWLVQDTSNQSVAAMKVLVGDMTIPEKKGGWDELATLKIIQGTNPLSPGYKHMCQLLDSFLCDGPNGHHVCLILDPMKLNVFEIYRCMPGAMPLPLLKRLSKHILLALQYLHDECGVIHTDIKGDNILLSGEPLAEGQLQVELDNDYLMSTVFKLSDFGAANLMTNRFAGMIQPESLRSPEAIIGAPWDTKTDIWNFGCLMYEFARGAKLFDPHWNNEESGMTPTQTHLAQMTGRCGSFPSTLLEQGTRTARYFDDKGCLLQGEGRYFISLEDLIARAEHSPQETAEVVDFLAPMLIINPQDRWSAKQMLEHPWLVDIEWTPSDSPPMILRQYGK